MSQWFRMYAEVLNDPKAQRLSGDDFKGWVNVLCLASHGDGTIPSDEDIAFALRIEMRKARKLLETLTTSGLIDVTETGRSPHNWNKRQYKSDVSTDRVKRFRNAKRNVSETPDETPPDTETEQTKAIDKSIASAAKRGSRLPKDFKMPGDWLQWAMDERHWSADDTRVEAANFIDHWHAKPGKDAVKLDWEATWRNWIRNSRRVAAVRATLIPL
jgi:hypothetical protein